MKVYTNENPAAMMDEINRIYGNMTVLVEAMLFFHANNCSPDYDGGLWAFHSDGTAGFWVPQGQTHYNVQVPSNYYANESMDAASFGLGLTILAVNHLLWKMYDGGNEELAEYLNDRYTDLMNLAYREDAGHDVCAVAGFID